MKKFTRVLAPVLALSLAASLFTGCGSKAEETQAAAAETQAAAAEKKEEAKADAAASESTGKDTLIIATANETPSVTTNLHNAVAGDYINEMTHSGLFKTNENLEDPLSIARVLVALNYVRNDVHIRVNLEQVAVCLLIHVVTSNSVVQVCC